MLLLTGCETENQHGSCIGIVEEKEPNLIYKPSVQNIVVGTLFFWLILPPVLVVTTDYQCPIAKRVNK
jgi:hypothetical protein